MDSFETFLPLIFAGLMGLSMLIYAVLDGYDLGVGMLMADAGPEHVVRMTWYITDRADYLDNARRIGEIYRAIMGRNYPAMAVVQVVALMEAAAKIEIEVTAVVPD